MRIHTRLSVATAAAVLGVTLSGCNNVLEVKPETFSGTTTYYQTPDQVDRAIFGAYSYLQTIYGSGANGPMWLLAEMRADNTTYEYNGSNRGLVLNETVDDFVTTPDNTGVAAMWNTSFAGILQTNTILDRIDPVTYADPAAKNRVIAEAKFLRALHYFNLVRLFGDVPVLLHETQSYDAAFTGKRVPTDSVYRLIIADLKDALPALPARSALPANQAGRATQGAASMLLADVYMTQKNWAAAAPLLQSVLAMGYTLNPSYDRVFDPAFKNGPESILEVQYAEGVVNESSAFTQRFIPLTSARDLTFGTTDQGNAGGWNIPTRDILRTYEPGDVRKSVSIGFYVNPANRNENDVAFGDTIPYVKKTYHRYSTAGRTNDDFQIYRYGETLLDYAETLNELGRTAEAYPFIDQVRARAGLPALTPGLTQAAFRDAVIKEERVELAFEDKRWFQLLRTGRVIPVMTAHLADLKTYAAANGRRGSLASAVTSNMLLFPLPVREVTTNIGLQQNPGY
jgi:starch-binding outer membrane protein, SusD/RagB family